MARIRTIKPEFWTSEQIVDLSIHARLLFIGLWNFSDDYGRHPDKPQRLKMQIFPAESIDVAELLRELIDSGLVATYDAGGESYLQVVNWAKHQKVGHPINKHPAPAGELTRRMSAHKSSRTFTPDVEVDAEADVEVDIEVEVEATPPAAPVRGRTDYSPSFETLWKAYPQRVGGKLAAYRQFQRLKPDDGDVAAWIDAISQLKLSDQWQRDGGQYIPHLRTWLSQGRFDDELPVSEIDELRQMFAGGSHA